MRAFWTNIILCILAIADCDNYGSYTENIPTLYGLIDGVRSVLIYNEIQSNRYGIERPMKYQTDTSNEYETEPPSEYETETPSEYETETPNDDETSNGNMASKRSSVQTWTSLQYSIIANVRHAQKLLVTQSLRPQFPPNIFFNFVRLESMSISHQEIPSITVIDFEGATELKYLNLSHNAIKIITPFTFANAKKLEVIDLSFNEIKSNLSDVFLNDHLREVHLHHNNLTYLELSWFNLDYLEILTLNDNNLFAIDVDTSLTKKFGSRHFLSIFNVANNPIKTAITMHADTVDLSRMNAQTCVIPLSVKKMHACCNQIEKIITVTADGNFSLTELDLSHNLIRSLVNLTKFHKLETLNLSYNSLDTIFGHMFVKMHKLEQLDLSHNNLKKIDFNFLLNTVGLLFLDISYNNLYFFRLNAVSISLKELHVEGNNLTTIDTNLKRMAPRMSRIGLNDNEWKCNYLITVVMLLQFDGIVPVMSGVGEGNSHVYDEDIKGIGCFSRDHVTDISLGNAYGETTTETNVEDFAGIKGKFKALEDRLLRAIDDKFIDITFRLNQTANYIDGQYH